MRRLLTYLCLFAVSTLTHAHQLDEYLQSTLVTIAPTDIHLSIHLTPGTAIANQVLTQIDTDHDGLISTNESNAYINQFQYDLALALDHQLITPTLTASDFPNQSDLTNGFGIVALELSAPITLNSGPHQLTITNHHLEKISAYVINAAQPDSPEIQIKSQTRNQTQSTTTIAFTYEPPISRTQKLTTITILTLLYCAMFTTARRLQRKRIA